MKCMFKKIVGYYVAYLDMQRRQIPLKCLVPVFKELLEDDGLLPLWQDLHLQHSQYQQVTTTSEGY